MSSKSVVGLVYTQGQAENVVKALKHGRFSNEDISVLFPYRNGTREFAADHETKTPEGALAGVGAGGALGGTLGLLLGFGALTIPGLGPFLAAGPIMAGLSGAAAGATVGGIAGALVGMGISESQAVHYEGKVKGGNILISVHVVDGEERTLARNILESGGAIDVALVGDQPTPLVHRLPIQARPRA